MYSTPITKFGLAVKKSSLICLEINCWAGFDAEQQNIQGIPFYTKPVLE